ncbi:MAG TPA: WecB/TagA/CpsF family glycosyltransferase [Candidatus Wallbacteria bacterium]|nr:WecB/TagA/CpsF family glycosyltransferase [Candidatus Wallbacteria bacterium]
MNANAISGPAAPRDYFGRPRLAIANIELDDLSFEEIIEYSNIIINEKKGNLFIVTLDILGAYNSIFDERYSSIISGAEIITCDGAGLKMLSKIKGGRAVKNKVSGVDLSARLLKEAAARGYRAAFIGARPEVISKLETSVLSDYRGIGETFFHHGYFTAAQRVSIIEKLSGFKPDIALIALGNPAQEKFIEDLKPFVKGCVLMGVGGTFDVLSGALKRAPVFMQKLYLEWLYRLMQQPSRISRMLNIPKYIVYVLFSEALKWLGKK